MKKPVLFFLVFFILATYIFFRAQEKPANPNPLPTAAINQPIKTPESAPRISVIATGLEVPWALAFLPDGALMVTERKGTIQLVKNDDVKHIAEISDVVQTGESGLHGLALHPEFAENQFVYLYYTYSDNRNTTLNRVVRYRFDGVGFSDSQIIVDAIPGAVFHDGGRIKFGPDNFLYITTGDALDPSRSQDKNSLAGKILRVTDQGEPAPGNPFGNRAYSFGHRNPQGIAWDDKGQLWETEHGNSAHDEVNNIEKGGNYAWPDIPKCTLGPLADSPYPDPKTPVLCSQADTWAPGGAAYLNGSIFFAGLRGQGLFEAKINNNPATVKKHFDHELGRIREVIVGPDNMLYITTSNRDGRGTPADDDDKILQINPAKL